MNDDYDGDDDGDDGGDDDDCGDCNRGACLMDCRPMRWAVWCLTKTIWMMMMKVLKVMDTVLAKSPAIFFFFN